jgi:hypothetical protein
MKTTLKMIPVSEIGHDPSFNFSRGQNIESAADNVRKWFNDEKEEISLAVSLAKLPAGWMPDKSIAVVSIDDTEITTTSEAIAQLRSDRRQQFADATENIEVKVNDNKLLISASDVLREYEDMYFGKNGQPLKAKYDGVTGFRRTFVLALANTIRRKINLPVIDAIPCVVYDNIPSKAARATICTLENTTQTEGSRALDGLDMLNAAASIVLYSDAGGSIEKQLSDAGFNRGAQQKYGSLIALHNKFPDVNVIATLTANAEVIKSIRAKEVRDLVKSETVTDDDVIRYLDNPAASTEVTPKAASGSKLESAEKGTPVKFVKDVLNAARTDTLSTLKWMNAEFAVLNAVYNALRHNDDPHGIREFLKNAVSEQSEVAAK